MTAKYKKDSSFFGMGSFQGIEDPGFRVIRNLVSTSGLALAFPQYLSLNC